MRFCPECGDLLIFDTESGSLAEARDKLLFTCSRCQKSFPSKEEDYLLLSQDIKTKMNARLFKNACKDITNPREFIKCPTCKKETIAVVLKIDETLRSVYICCQCENKIYWST